MQDQTSQENGERPAPPATAKDPVCGMNVTIATAKHTHEHAGQTYYFCSGGCRTKFIADPARYVAEEPAENTKAKDPVCGMSVTVATAKHSHEHAGKTYYFCCAGCRTKFIADPQRYLGDTPAKAPSSHPPAAKAGAVFTCPMHPEIRKEGPGSCPLCGMALEPLEVTAESGPNPELIDFTRRLWVGALFAVPLLVLEMGTHIGLHTPIPHHVLPFVEAVLATPVVLWSGWPFFVRGVESLRSGHLNMFTLIAMGTGLAYLYSLAATLFPGWVPETFRASGMVPLYFESAAVIIVLVLVGQILELRARDKTSGAIRGLLALAPPTARKVFADGTERDIALEEVHPGDRLRIRPGEKIPVDGVIREGRSAIDESMITGEAMPVTRAVGASVIGGTMNTAGGLLIEAQKVGSDTVLARIVQLVTEAQRSAAPIQRLADRVSGWFVPIVLGVAALAFASWAIFGPEPRLAHGLIAAVTVLIIACPCAVGLATPMSIMVGVGRGATSGVLVKSAAALERFERADMLVIDKTGTLTEGHPAVVDIFASPAFAKDEVLASAAAVERHAEHPIAKAIVAAAESGKGTAAPATEFQAASGQGVTGLVQGRRVRIGSETYAASGSALATDLNAWAADRRAQGATVVFVTVDESLAGAIAVADPERPESAQTLRALEAEGIAPVMLTGDSRGTALAVAQRLGLSQVEAEATPERKAAYVKQQRDQGHIVAMAGDGINDAPALAMADIGIAMGSGTDVAMESAGITLLHGDLRGLLRARRLSQATMRNIRQNLFLAFIYNAAGVPIAAGILYPHFGIIISPIVAALAMSLSSVSVVGNALRLSRLKLD